MKTLDSKGTTPFFFGLFKSVAAALFLLVTALAEPI